MTQEMIDQFVETFKTKLNATPQVSVDIDNNMVIVKQHKIYIMPSCATEYKEFMIPLIPSGSNITITAERAKQTLNHAVTITVPVKEFEAFSQALNNSSKTTLNWESCRLIGTGSSVTLSTFTK